MFVLLFGINVVFIKNLCFWSVIVFNIYYEYNYWIRVLYVLFEDKVFVKLVLIKILYFRIIYVIKLKVIVKDVGISEYG